MTKEFPVHPAPFSKIILQEIVGIVFDESVRKINKGEGKKLKILDPFAGIGKIHELSNDYITTVGVELEKEWANQHPQNEVGNALKLRFRKNSFDVVCTSPTYPNRITDHHNAKDGSHRRTYKHYLGRDLSPESSSVMSWGQEYRDFHEKAVAEALRVLKPDGLLIWNISNHMKTITKGNPPAEQRVSEWYLGLFLSIGLMLHSVVRVPTPRYRYGSNSESRTECEFIICMRKPV